MHIILYVFCKFVNVKITYFWYKLCRNFYHLANPSPIGFGFELSWFGAPIEPKNKPYCNG